jgi:hypothetical protein
LVQEVLADHMRSKLIAPESSFKEVWDVIIVVLTVYISIELPLRIAYNYRQINIFFDIFITFLLFIDIVITFNTKIYAKGVLIDNPKRIAKNYVHTLFLFDFLAAVPFFLIYLVFPALAWLQLLSLTRLFKLIRLHTLISKWRNRQVINPSILRLGVFFFWIFLIAHWIACIWIYIARIEGSEEIPTYVNAIYWCITTITTVGYGDISPVSDLQKALTMVAMFLGVGVYGYVIGNIASLLSNIDVAKSAFLKQMEDINSFLSYKSVPKKLKQKVHNYYQYVWHNRMAHSEEVILTNLPPSLKTEILLHIHRKLIEQVPFFKNTRKEFISDIILCLQPKVFLPGDFIFKKGDIGNCMYFIGNGSVDVLSTDESSVVATLKEGDYFGEIALIKKVKRTKSVVAREYCNFYALEKNNFDALLEKYPTFKSHIYETFKKRDDQSSDGHIST